MRNNRNPSILVILIAGIGDLVLASVSLRALRAGFPDADIHLITSVEAASIAKNYSFINKVWSFPIRELRGNKSYLIEILKLMLSLRRIVFASIVNLYQIGSLWGALKMGLIFICLKGKSKVGHGDKGFSLFLTKKLPADTFRSGHLAEGMMTIAIAAGGVAAERDTSVYWEGSAEEKWHHLFQNERHIRIIGINPGGDRKNRRWNPDRFALLADWLVEQYDARIIVFGGPGEEEIALHIEKSMRSKSINLAGKLSLNELCYIISRLDLLVTNDSGPMHIAAATKTPLVAIFGPEDPRMTGPYTSSRLYRIISEPVYCRPCNRDECDHPVCLDLITPEIVLKNCAELLREKNSSTGI